jgi:endonuclease/exonuclease/phosphatase family metal-dependent hydrolase
VAGSIRHQPEILTEAASLSEFLTKNSNQHTDVDLLYHNKLSKEMSSAKDDFTIVTWNIWFANYCWRERLCVTLLETLEQDPDVVCFQEVTQNLHQIMLHCEAWRQHYDPIEEQLPCLYDCAIWIRKEEGSSSYGVLSNHHQRITACGPPTTVAIPSIYGRRGLYVDLKLLNHSTNNKAQQSMRFLRVMTTHLESGNDKWAADTRRAQLDVLKRVSLDDDSSSSTADTCSDPTPLTLLVGDMNMDPSYPENEALPGVDLWCIAQQHNEEDSCADPAGYTEDTYVNEMRFVAHQRQHKQVRYDRILLLSANANNTPPPHQTLVAVDMKRLGMTPFQAPGVSPCNKEGPLLWPSNHFGLVARLSDIDHYSFNKK